MLHYTGGFFVLQAEQAGCTTMSWGALTERPQSLTVRFFSVARPRDVPSAALMVPVALYSTWSIEKKSQSGPAALCLRWCHRDYFCVFWNTDATCFFAHQSQYIYIHHFMRDDCSGAEEVPSTKKLCWFCWLQLPFDNAVNVYGIIMCNSTFLRESWSPNSSAWQFFEYAVMHIAKESLQYLTSSTTDFSWSRKLCSLPITSCTQKLRKWKRFSSSASCWIGICEHDTNVQLPDINVSV